MCRLYKKISRRLFNDDDEDDEVIVNNFTSLESSLFAIYADIINIIVVIY